MKPQKEAADEKRDERRKNEAEEIARTELILDLEQAENLKGKAMKAQFKAFKAAGAPNLEGIAPSSLSAPNMRKAIVEAVRLYISKEWVPVNERQDEEVDEIINLDGQFVEGETDWEDLQDSDRED